MTTEDHYAKAMADMIASCTLSGSKDCYFWATYSSPNQAPDGKEYSQ